MNKATQRKVNEQLLANHLSEVLLFYLHHKNVDCIWRRNHTRRFDFFFREVICWTYDKNMTSPFDKDLDHYSCTKSWQKAYAIKFLETELKEYEKGYEKTRSIVLDEAHYSKEEIADHEQKKTDIKNQAMTVQLIYESAIRNKK
jgi:hypothetical protein